jgi:hypothetical protein
MAPMLWATNYAFRANSRLFTKHKTSVLHALYNQRHEMLAKNRAVPAIGGPVWDNWPVDIYASNKRSLTVLSVLFGTKFDFNFESSQISHPNLTSGGHMVFDTARNLNKIEK